MHSIKLGQYKDLQIKKTKPMTDEELANATEKAFADAVKSLEKFTREIKIGDTILVKIEAKVDGQTIQDLCKDEMEYEVGNISMLTEYSKAAGKKVGQGFEMHIPYSANCPIKAARGKVVDYNVSILDARFNTPAEITDDMLKIIDPQAKSADDVKAKLKMMIKGQNEQNVFESNVLKVMETIKEKAQVTLDGQEYDRQYHDIINQSAEMYKQSNIPLPPNCTDIKNDKHFLDNCKDVTERVVMETLIINAVAEAENITVSKDDIENSKKFFASTPEAKAEFEKQFPDDYSLSQFLLRNMVFDSIMKWNLVD